MYLALFIITILLILLSIVMAIWIFYYPDPPDGIIINKTEISNNKSPSGKGNSITIMGSNKRSRTIVLDRITWESLKIGDFYTTLSHLDTEDDSFEEYS